jgi:Xaa-Pro aminopeptidase
VISTDRLQARLQEEGVDLLIASSPQNVYYTSSLRSTSQELLGETAFSLVSVGAERPRVVLPAVDATVVLDTDVVHDEAHTYGSFTIYEDESPGASNEDLMRLLDGTNHEDPMTAFSAALESYADADSTIAVEDAGLSNTGWDEVLARLPSDDVVTADGMLSDLRRIKNEAEVDRLRRSVEITEAAIESTVEAAEAGMTEREMLNVFRSEQAKRGAEPLFAVVAFGEHSAYPHAVPTDRALEVGDLIRFDVGCRYEQYSSDIARTYAFGERDPVLAEQYRVLNESMDLAMELLGDHEPTDVVFEEAVAYVREEGAEVFDDFDRNHYGHGIGIDVYDAPTINRESSEVLEGMVFCVEPPYYKLGTGGLQIEDEIRITDSGYERFTTCPAELPVVD